MNRLVVIGNGFDLAHGLKTDYKSFLVWYLKDALKKSLDGKGFRDCFIRVRDYLNNSISGEGDFKYINEFDKLMSFGEDRNIKIINAINIGGDLYRKLFFQNKNTWVDIERDFYQVLTTIANQKDEVKRNERIEKLNIEFDYLITRLKEYLASEVIHFKPIVRNYDDLLSLTCYVRDTSNKSLEPLFTPNIYPSHTWFVNFNYTQSHSTYKFERDKFSTINIHGTLDKNIVFGYGDEIGEEYKLLENLNDNNFLKYVKYFGYLHSEEYDRLVHAIELDEFEVFVWGHSCGLSDRTLLSKIFQHKNCRKIRVFYYKKDDKTNNYTDIVQNISRHFSSKEEFLNKVVGFQTSYPLPQRK